jgi:NAD-reducing hydrogenase large subunit
MGQTITISPITRVEGHGKVTIHLNDLGEVDRSYFHVVEFRGFEEFCKGRLLSDMPTITPRICGICPASHHLVSAKASDDAWNVSIPPTAQMLRELMLMGQFIQSHALHFFYLAAPDFIMGPASNPAKRNVVGLINADPELGKKAIRLRQIGQNIIDCVGGRPIHPVAAIPGGMSKPLSYRDRDRIMGDLHEGTALAQLALQLGKEQLDGYADMIPTFANFESCYMGMTKDGSLELYDGIFRLIDETGYYLKFFDAANYSQAIGEHVEDWSYLKFPFLKDKGWPEGTYRVGPLARLNVADSISTPLAGRELPLFKRLGQSGNPVHPTLYYHYARLIELLYAVERAEQLIENPSITNKEVRVPVKRQSGEGVGIIEAPRGTLIHHYWVDNLGKITKANMIVATTHNNAGINRSVNEVAKRYVKGGQIEEGALNMVEMAVRCYDPCLSCSTHAIGQMPLELQLISPEGKILEAVERTP